VHNGVRPQDRPGNATRVLENEWGEGGQEGAVAALEQEKAGTKPFAVGGLVSTIGSAKYSVSKQAHCGTHSVPAAVASTIFLQK
jgi:hypothetical protein